MSYAESDPADVQTRQSSHGDLSHVDTIIVPTLFMGKLIGQKVKICDRNVYVAEQHFRFQLNLSLSSNPYCFGAG